MEAWPSRHRHRANAPTAPSAGSWLRWRAWPSRRPRSSESPCLRQQARAPVLPSTRRAASTARPTPHTTTTAATTTQQLRPRPEPERVADHRAVRDLRRLVTAARRSHRLSQSRHSSVADRLVASATNGGRVGPPMKGRVRTEPRRPAVQDRSVRATPVRARRAAAPKGAPPSRTSAIGVLAQVSVSAPTRSTRRPVS
jgi:hypothetical protein